MIFTGLVFASDTYVHVKVTGFETVNHLNMVERDPLIILLQKGLQPKLPPLTIVYLGSR